MFLECPARNIRIQRTLQLLNVQNCRFANVEHQKKRKKRDCTSQGILKNVMIVIMCDCHVTSRSDRLQRVLSNIRKSPECTFGTLCAGYPYSTVPIDGITQPFLRPSGCERPGNSAASSPPRHSTIRSKRQHFSRAAESQSRHPDRCSPLGPARGHVAHNAHSGPVGRRAEGEASAAALRLSSSQSQAPAR